LLYFSLPSSTFYTTPSTCFINSLFTPNWLENYRQLLNSFLTRRRITEFTTPEILNTWTKIMLAFWLFGTECSELLRKKKRNRFTVWARCRAHFVSLSFIFLFTGLVHALSTWDILWAQVHHVAAVLEDVRKCSGFFNKISILFAPPGWRLPEEGSAWIAPEIPPINPKQKKYSPPIPTKLVIYITTQFLATFIIAVVFIYTKLQFNLLETILMCVYIAYCLEVYGLVMNQSRHNTLTLEAVRIALDFCVLHYFFPSMAILNHVVGLSAAFKALSIAWLFVIREEFKFLPASKAPPVGTAST